MKLAFTLFSLCFALLGCTARQELHESAERNEATAAQWRTPDADGLQLHFAEQAQAQAKQERQEADNMPQSEEFFRAVLGLFLGEKSESK